MENWGINIFSWVDEKKFKIALDKDILKQEVKRTWTFCTTNLPKKFHIYLHIKENTLYVNLGTFLDFFFNNEPHLSLRTISEIFTFMMLRTF